MIEVHQVINHGLVHLTSTNGEIHDGHVHGRSVMVTGGPVLLPLPRLYTPQRDQIQTESASPPRITSPTCSSLAIPRGLTGTQQPPVISKASLLSPVCIQKRRPAPPAGARAVSSLSTMQIVQPRWVHTRPLASRHLAFPSNRNSGVEGGFALGILLS